MLSSFRKQQTARRYTGGYWDDNGEWQAGTYEEFTFMASVQPLNANETQQYTEMMPEGGIQFSAVKIYTDTPLNVSRQGLPDGQPLVEADVLVWRGRLWKVVNREDWQSDVINHYRHVAWEIQPAETEDDDDATNNS